MTEYYKRFEFIGKPVEDVVGLADTNVIPAAYYEKGARHIAFNIVDIIDYQLEEGEKPTQFLYIEFAPCKKADDGVFKLCNDLYQNGWFVEEDFVKLYEIDEQSCEYMKVK